MKNPGLLGAVALFATTLLAPLSAVAEVRLPGFFGDHMVLQRGIPIPVWGWADPGESVHVQIGEGGTKVAATAGADGRWQVKLPVMEAGGPHVLTVTAANTLTIRDILIGEVWLCSGQSNMEWSVSRSMNPEKEIAAADYPQIRHMKIGRVTSGYPKDDVAATWQLCSPETAGNFTAAGYFMARELHRELGVPIGLLNSSWGGTRIDPWTPIAGFAEVPALKDIRDKVARTQPDHPAYRKIMSRHIETTRKWLEGASKAIEAAQPVPASPAFPAGLSPLTARTDPSAIYHAMIHPLLGYGMRGAIWYQGESNHSEGMLYHEKKKALVAGWRKLWGLGDFPFYYVQIAPYQYGKEDPRILARFWEAQATSLEIPNTGMVVTSDIGNVKDIHPKNKQEVGRRLSLLALKHTYGKSDLVASGPVFESMQIEPGQLRIKFRNTAGGLKARDGKPLSHFEVIGEEGGFVPAAVRIEGDSLLLTSPEVDKPVAMRFAWHKLAEPNLANGAGLPATAFRAGEVPVHDVLSREIDEAEGYELVYDLDLRKLGSTISYTADRAGEIKGGFDRIAYLIELQSGQEAPKYAWASMDAFTDDLGKIGIPTVGTKARFQTGVSKLNIVSNVEGLKTGTGLPGNIEFWPNNYREANGGRVKGASPKLYDFGDQPGDTVDGYGCMQVHHTAAKQTVFAVNHWKQGAQADLGIGNSRGNTRDWTFTKNADAYESARLRVLVRPKGKRP